MLVGGCKGITYNDSRNAVLGVAVALQVLGNCGEDAGGERHVEYPVGLTAALLEFLKVVLKLNEGFILVVLARDVCAKTAKLL
jgi:hypothetical protein